MGGPGSGRKKGSGNKSTKTKSDPWGGKTNAWGQTYATWKQGQQFRKSQKLANRISKRKNPLP